VRAKLMIYEQMTYSTTQTGTSQQNSKLSYFNKFHSQLFLFFILKLSKIIERSSGVEILLFPAVIAKHPRSILEYLRK
jgi:hypothetical protein